MKKNDMRRWALAAALVGSLSLSACSQPMEAGNTTSPTEITSPSLPAITEPSSVQAAEIDFSLSAERGAYTLESVGMVFTVMVDGTEKYSCMESQDGSRTLELWLNQEEMVLLENLNGSVTCYMEKIESTEIFENPLKRIYDSLDGLDFTPVGDNAQERTFQNIRIERTAKQKTSAYTCYEVDLTWTDNRVYAFEYYEYEDGGRLVSADAPKEINPAFTQDCAWNIDIANKAIVNQETGQEVPIQITGSSTGTSASVLEDSNPEYKEREQKTLLWTDQKGAVTKISFDDTFLLTVLSNFELPQSVLPDDCAVMSDEDALSDMMLMFMLEGLGG